MDEWKTHYDFRFEMERAAQEGYHLMNILTGEVVKLKEGPVNQFTSAPRGGIGIAGYLAILVVVAGILFYAYGDQVYERIHGEWVELNAKYEEIPLEPKHVSVAFTPVPNQEKDWYRQERYEMLKLVYAGEPIRSSDWNNNFRAVADALNEIADVQRMQYHQQIMHSHNEPIFGYGRDYWGNEE